MKKPSNRNQPMKSFEKSRQDKEKYPEGSPKDKAMDKRQMPAFLKAKAKSRQKK